MLPGPRPDRRPRPRAPWRLPCGLLFAILCMGLLGGCRLRDGAGEEIVVPELVRTHLYVAPGGSDSNPGTSTEPFRTLARASQAASPGTTVHVAPGIYFGGLRTVANGTAEARIVYQSTERWGARIVPQLDARQSAAWDNRGNHVDIVGFEIDGAQYQSGMKWLTGIYNGGSHDSIRDNRIHHIANDVPCEPRGGAGITLDSYYKGKDSEAAGNQVHDIGPPGCASFHGVAVNTSAGVRNNIVYRIAGSGIHLWHDASRVAVHANTVAGSGSGIVVGAGDFFQGKGPNDHTEVSNNIVVDNGHGILERGAVGPNNSFRNNLVHGNHKEDWELAPGRHHAATVSAPPHFVDYSQGGTPDFRLRPNSPAIGQGLAPDSAESENGAARATGPASGLGTLRKADIGALPFSDP